jgi:predicted component of type VI protein secretion system
MIDSGNSFYTLPLRLDKIVNRKPVSSCTLQESIAQNIYLLITTGFKELRFDHSYGCRIWEQDFEIMANIKWKDTLSFSLEETIKTHEKRLKDIKVKIEIEEYKFLNKENTRIKKKLNVKAEGFTVKTNEKFEFMEQIFIAPFSLE